MDQEGVLHCDWQRQRPSEFRHMYQMLTSV